VSWAIRGCTGASKLRALVQGMDSRPRMNELFDLALQAGEREEGWFMPIFTSGEG
jgi:hypothetical protein